MAHTTKPSSNVISFDPYKTFDPKPMWAHATSSKGPGRIVCTAGQVGADENNIVPPNIDDEIALAFTNLRRCLDATGALVTDVLKLVYYIVDYDPDNRPHSKHLAKFLGGHRPTTTLIPVTKLARPDYHFEIEATASVEQLPRQMADVVIVGAGLSGLSAAHEVQKAGMSCVVAEARDRVGGKTLSIEPLNDGRTIDLGAAWINDTNQKEVFALSKSLGLELVQQNTSGSVIQEDIDGSVSQFPYGSKLSEPNGVDNMVFIRELADEVSRSLNLYAVRKEQKAPDHLTFAQWLHEKGATPTAIASATVWTRAMLGLEPPEMSALFFLDYCRRGGGLSTMRSDRKDGGQYLRFAKGSQQLSLGLAKLLRPGSLMLKSPVQKIKQAATGVLVSTARGEILAKRVIVTVPTPLYHLIDFYPALPESKVELSQKNRLGYTNKVMLLYDRPWWRHAGLCGLLQSFKGPVTVSRDSSVDETGQFSLTCFTVGQPGRELSKLQQHERYERVKQHIRKLFGAYTSVPEPINVSEYEWGMDQWAQGCPCPASPPGLLSKLDEAMRAAHGKIHFAGTETAYEWKGYMDGAISSGKRAAQETMVALTQSKL
ncbi:hypothetical protein N7474_000228 [Penicillium riverlandense]|uniref:uncharacterized protein n=1 Tax=Penicillium riverlandense TaxID=1903569 RepID=UPI00254789F2|nr:uncharacterized protein N7474_000228 [Penicillium riverlandense]KAJ5831917.1 hypothetical protein N7474_000228 [Penicillium riverlandense]